MRSNGVTLRGMMTPRLWSLPRRTRRAISLDGLKHVPPNRQMWWEYAHDKDARVVMRSGTAGHIKAPRRVTWGLNNRVLR